MSTWRPPERIRHDAQPGRWPSAAEAARSRLFAPVQVGASQLSQRTWVPAMVPWRASEDGLVTPSVLAWYERFARGRPGAIVVEATGIRDVASGPLLRIGEARFIAGLNQLVETVRRASAGETRLFIQLIDFLSIRRRPDAQKFFERFLAITPQHRRALDMPDATDGEVRDPARGTRCGRTRGCARRTRARSAAHGRPRAHHRHRSCAHRGACRSVLARTVCRSPPRALAKRASTASSCTTRTPIRWPRSCRRPIREATATGAIREHRVRLPLEVLAAVRARTRR